MAYQSYEHDDKYEWDLRGDGTLIADVAYRDASAANTLDLYLPTTGEKPFPVVVYVHGGGYVQGDKVHHLSPLLHVLARGYALACVNYRLSDEAPFPAVIQDVVDAVEFIQDNAGKWGLDAGRVLLWGETHGAYVTDRIAIDGPKGNLDSLGCRRPANSLSLAGVVSMYAPIDLAGYYRSKMADKRLNLGPEIFASICDVFAQDADGLYPYLDAQNPLARIDGTECPFYLIHGELDDEIPHENTYALDAALTKAGVEHVTDIVEGGRHGLDYYDNERGTDPILRFIDHVFAR